MTDHKQDALEDIRVIAATHGLTLDEVVAVFHPTRESERKKSSGLAAQIFGYLGGLLVIGGLSVLISMEWNYLDSFGRVLITLGPGFATFLVATYFTTEPRFEKAATPLFLLAASIQPTGILIALHEYAHGNNPAEGVLFMCFVMLIQQGLVFLATQRTVLALTSLLFVLCFVATFLDLYHMDAKYISMVLGASSLGLGFELAQTRHRALAPFTHFLGSVLFLSGFGDVVLSTKFELAFLGMSSFFVYLSVLARSRVLLGVSALALLAFISAYSEQHFIGVLGWPLTLIAGGTLMIGLGVAVVKINSLFVSRSAIAQKNSR